MIENGGIIGAPIDRDVLRAVDHGYLVTCSALRCNWQGLFGDRETAIDAINNHVSQQRSHGSHYGRVTAHLVKFIDDRTAHATTDTHHVYHGQDGPDDPLSFERPANADRVPSDLNHDVDGPPSASFPVTPGDQPGVDELVDTGDMIETHGPEPGKVWKVVETRSIGLPTWTIVYLPPDYDGWPQNGRQRKQDCYWLNELVAVDGTIRRRYGSEQHYRVLGTSSDYQAVIGDYGNP